MDRGSKFLQFREGAWTDFLQEAESAGTKSGNFRINRKPSCEQIGKNKVSKACDLTTASASAKIQRRKCSTMQCFLISSDLFSLRIFSKSLKLQNCIFYRFFGTSIWKNGFEKQEM